MSISTKLAATFFVIITSVSHASLFPRGCEITGYGFSKNFLILNEQGGQTFFLIQNRSNKQIELEHFETQQDVFMSPKLESKIAPKNWSAFASDEENTYFQCFMREAGTKVKVDCREALEVCEYPRVKFALSNMGNYWVSTDKPQAQVLKDATAKGIYLHW